MKSRLCEFITVCAINVHPRASKMSGWPLISTPISPRKGDGAAEERAPALPDQQSQGRHCIF